MSSQLLIRADASPAIGTGHVMRMIALAQEWTERGGKVIFVSADCPRSLVSRIESENLDHHLIDVPAGTDQDVQGTLELVRQFGCTKVVIDGYRFGFDFQQKLKSDSVFLMVVDDFRYARNWYADAILNQNLFAEDWTYSSEIPGARFLLGSNYVLLRKELRDLSSRARRANPADQLNLLITLGGGDAALVSEPLLEILESVPAYLLNIHLIVGGACTSLTRLEEMISTSRHEIELIVDVRDMSQEFHWADAVISGAGSTCWEWLYFRLPGAIVRMADNQMPVADELVRRNLAVDLGWHSDLNSRPDVGKLLEGLLLNVRSNKGKQQLTESHGSELVDGLGSKRVCDVLEEN